MSVTYPQAVEALSQLNVWKEGAYTVNEQLGDGPTNQTWLVTHEQKKYVLRKIKPLADTFKLSLKHELNVTAAASSSELTAHTIASSTRYGLVLREYVEGRVWENIDLHSERNLRRLAELLRRVHALTCDARPLEIRATLERYASVSDSEQVNDLLNKALSQLQGVSHRPAVVCHNDLTAPNIIESERLNIIDWEYAALGDPLFDLAVVVTHHALGPELRDFLLVTYLGGSDEAASVDLVLWCEIYGYLCTLWELSSQAG